MLLSSSFCRSRNIPGSQGFQSPDGSEGKESKRLLYLQTGKNCKMLITDFGLRRGGGMFGKCHSNVHMRLNRQSMSGTRISMLRLVHEIIQKGDYGREVGGSSAVWECM